MLLENTVEYIDRTTRGKVIALSSLRGGSGTTTVATMLAMLIAGDPETEVENSPSVVVVDMSADESQYGLIYGSSSFNTESLLEAVSKNYWEMTDETVLNHVVYSSDHHHCALLGTSNSQVFSGLGDDGWRDIIEILVNRFDVVILDYPNLSDSSQTLMTASMASDAIVLVSEYSAYAVKEVRSFVEKVGLGENPCFDSNDVSKFSVVLNHLEVTSIIPSEINGVSVIGNIEKVENVNSLVSGMHMWDSNTDTEAFKHSFSDMYQALSRLSG